MRSNSEEPKWLSIQECANRLGVHKNTIRGLLLSGKLPATRFSSRVIRVALTDLETFGKAYEGGELGQWKTRA